jgi:hypothetical protein
MTRQDDWQRLDNWFTRLGRIESGKILSNCRKIPKQEPDGSQSV